MSDWVEVCAEDELPVGGYKIVDVDDVVIAVFNVEGEYYAIEDVCTHDGGDLACGTLDGDTIICPRHGARFSLKTGAVLEAPAYEPVAIFPVQVEDGVIHVRDDRWD